MFDRKLTDKWSNGENFFLYLMNYFPCSGEVITFSKHSKIKSSTELHSNIRIGNHCTFIQGFVSV